MQGFTYDDIDETLIEKLGRPRVSKPRVRQAMIEGVKGGLTFKQANAILGEFGESICLDAFQSLTEEANGRPKSSFNARGSPSHKDVTHSVSEASKGLPAVIAETEEIPDLQREAKRTFSASFMKQ